MFQGSIKILFFLSFFTIVNAQTVAYNDGNFEVECPDKKISFKVVSSRQDQSLKYSDFSKYTEKSQIKKILEEPCGKNQETFFIEAKKSTHEYCLSLEKDFYKKIEEIDKDEAVQMELTDALLNDEQYSGITDELIFQTRTMLAYCLLRDSISAELK